MTEALWTPIDWGEIDEELKAKLKADFSTNRFFTPGSRNGPQRFFSLKGYALSLQDDQFSIRKWWYRTVGNITYFAFTLGNPSNSVYTTTLNPSGKYVTDRLCGFASMPHHPE